MGRAVGEVRAARSARGAFFAPAVRTLAYTAIATLLCLAIGYPVAYTVARHARRWKGALLALLLAPFFISYLMRMLAWVNLLRDDGLVNRVLEACRSPSLSSGSGASRSR